MIFKRQLWRIGSLLLVIQWMAVVCISLLIAIYFGYNLSPEKIAYFVSCSILASFIWSVWSWKIAGGSIFDPYILFLIASTLFNGGSAFVFLFKQHENYAQSGGLFNIYDSVPFDTIVQVWLLVLLGLAAFHLGALAGAVLSQEKRKSATNEINIEYATSMRRIRQIGWSMLLVSLLPTALSLQNSVIGVLSGGYFAGWIQRTSTGSFTQILGAFFIPGVLFIIAGSKRKPLTISVAVLSLMVYVVAYFFIGVRRLAVMPLIAAAWLWDRSVSRFPRGLLLIGAFAVLFIVFPVVRFTRTTAGTEKANPLYFWQQYIAIENPALEVITEMGESTLVPLAYTLELVPESRPFDFGVSYLYSLSSPFPNLGNEVHPAAVRSLAPWLARTVAPNFAALGGGYGFSFISEAYLNFGWIGAPFVLGFLGFLYAYFVLWATNSTSPLRIATVASFLSFFLLFSRGESYLLPRQLIWYSLIPYFLVRFIPPVRLFAPRKNPLSLSKAIDSR